MERLTQPDGSPLRSTLAFLEWESVRRAKGTHPGMMRLADDELAALLELLRRKLGAAAVSVGAEIFTAGRRRHAVSEHYAPVREPATSAIL